MKILFFILMIFIGSVLMFTIELFVYLSYFRYVCYFIIWPVFIGFFYYFPSSQRISVFITLLKPYIFIALHIYTIFIAFNNALWKGLLTIVLPYISQIYWFFAMIEQHSTLGNLYSLIILFYLLIATQPYISLMGFKIYRDDILNEVNKEDEL